MASQDDEEIEEEADEEVEKVLHELTDGLLGEAKQVGPALEEPEPAEEEEEADHLEQRLNALRS